MLHILEDIWDGVYERIVKPLLQNVAAVAIALTLLTAVSYYFS
ncbi:hypothetical protein ACT3XG_15710 [Paenibacillus polymyxa]|nr:MULTISPECIES: hypothetical protein [Paenibacillus]MDU8671944.1 hypothetical protein [Paenibacillus polymyxa]MDU8696853.1 hypothetical protein [Paenibacillus polymyxa]MEE4577025.1 hypothetical protein [Paenibacillus polymyxa]UZP71212.1 hypothetical protein MF623_06465 [Paenibacillus polymyxa]UZS75844.1 hypothetical protein MF620_06480 [Paenibacillus polymyxa]